MFLRGVWRSTLDAANNLDVGGVFSFTEEHVPRFQKKRKSRTTAPATILFTQAKNEEGKKQLCVYAQCAYGGTVYGPVWSHSPNAVSRCLCELTKKCDCGRQYHKHRFTEGSRVVTKTKAK